MLDLPDSSTLSVHEAAAVLCIGEAAIRSEIREHGTVAGVRVIKVGRKIRIPTAPLRRLLGLEEG